MTFEDAVGQLNAAYFFREFTFSTNTFKPTPNSQLELADKVVWLDDVLILSQIKERKAPPNTTAQREQSWFQDEILKKATRQIRDTISYLHKYPQIKVLNNHGDEFDLSTTRTKHAHKTVIYDAHELLPADCSLRKYHHSRAVGVIHLVHSAAYFGILQTLITPAEIDEYLVFREGLVENWGAEMGAVTEKALVGQYLRNLPTWKPDPKFEKYVDEVTAKPKDWDLSRIIHLFRERRTTAISPVDTSYKVLRELAKLYRTEMGEFKKRFEFSMEKALSDEPCLPHRFTTSKGCGFVFIPLRRKDSPHRRNALLNFTTLNKYDQRLEKCIGLTVIAEGNGSWCDVQWYPMEFPWRENPKLQSALREGYPFRPVKKGRVERYGLSDLAE